MTRVSHRHPKRPSQAGEPSGTGLDWATPIDNAQDTPAQEPTFAQPERTPDPSRFKIPHADDKDAYRAIDALNREHKLHATPFPPPRGLPEPRLSLDQVWGTQGQTRLDAIDRAGQLVFHAVGDTGSVKGPSSQNLVADKMNADFDDPSVAEQPSFYFHLGDVVYNFGEAEYYYDQFYDPYREYPAPILALAGNHDGMVPPGATQTPLGPWLRNFCQERFAFTPEAGGLSRTAQIQPGVFFTFEAPNLRILALYSNTLEDPGVIADDNCGHSQIAYLEAALARVKAERFHGALVLAHHHPAYTAGAKHGWSLDLRRQVDAVCEKHGVWPHAVLSAHAHNYQRFTRMRGAMQIPYIIAGNGGHGLARLSKRGGQGLRTPMRLASDDNETVVLENYDDQSYGYLRVVVTSAQLRIEYHPADDGDAAKTPDDFVTVDLASRKLVHFTGFAAGPSEDGASRG